MTSDDRERFTALETEFRLHRERTEKDMTEIKESIKQLLSFKSQGQGAFWLATTIFGAAFAVFLTYLTTWFR